MQNEISIEQRLGRIEQLLLGQKNVLTFDVYGHFPVVHVQTNLRMPHTALQAEREKHLFQSFRTGKLTSAEPNPNRFRANSASRELRGKLLWQKLNQWESHLCEPRAKPDPKTNRRRPF